MSIATVVGRLVDTDDDGTGATGTIYNNARTQLLQDKVDAVVGDWTNVTFSAGNFTANGAMTWTVQSGDVSRNRYQLINKQLHWQISLVNTSVGGTPNTLLILTIPTGTFFTTANYARAVFVTDNGTFREALVQVQDGTHIVISLIGGANWAAAANTTQIVIDTQFEVG